MLTWNQLRTIWMWNVCSVAETLGGSRYSLLSVWGPGPWGVSSYAPHSVQHHDHWPCTLLAEEHLGKAHLPGYTGFRYPPVDVLHPSCCHWEVREAVFRCSLSIGEGSQVIFDFCDLWWSKTNEIFFKEYISFCLFSQGVQS